MSESKPTQLTPVFIIYLNEQRLSVDMESDVKEILVEKRIDQSSTFGITMSDMGQKWTDHPDFIEGAKIKIMLGYKDAVEEVMSGVVTGKSTVFRKNSDERIMIKGHDIIHRLHRGKKTITYANMTDKEIVEKIAGDAGVGVDCEEIGKMQTFAVQTNQTDYEYLLEMGNRYNCKMMTRDGKLIYKPIEDGSREEVIAEWGKTLIEFHPDLDSTRLVTDVEVHGWDIAKKKEVEGAVGFGDIEKTIGEGKAGGVTVLDNYGNTKLIVTDAAINDKNSAEKRAIETITRNSMTYIDATATVQGNNKIDAGMMINIKEVGKIFSGEYFVTEAKHRFIAEQGYTTSFTCIRNAVGGDIS
jgi:phage protein D